MLCRSELFVREFQVVLDPSSNQLMKKPIKKLVELELSLVTELQATAVAVLGLADLLAKE